MSAIVGINHSFTTGIDLYDSTTLAQLNIKKYEHSKTISRDNMNAR